MRLSKKTPPDQTPPKMFINSRGAVAVVPETFLDSGIVQSQIAASRRLKAKGNKLERQSAEQ